MWKRTEAAPDTGRQHRKEVRLPSKLILMCVEPHHVNLQHMGVTIYSESTRERNPVYFLNLMVPVKGKYCVI